MSRLAGLIGRAFDVADERLVLDLLDTLTSEAGS